MKYEDLDAVELLPVQELDKVVGGASSIEYVIARVTSAAAQGLAASPHPPDLAETVTDALLHHFG